MAVIKGNLVSKFVDRGIEVTVFLNNEKNTQAANADMQPPKLLDNTVKVSNGNYIGKAVVCQDGSHIAFQVTTNKGLCGLQPKIKTQQEMITENIFWTTTQRYGRTGAWVTRYETEKRTIKVSDFTAYEKTEGFQRSNVIVSANEVISFVKNGVTYPTAGVEANVRPGGLDKGAGAGSDFWTGSATFGGELGAMQMQFFVLKDAAAVVNFAEALRGVTADDDWD